MTSETDRRSAEVAKTHHLQPQSIHDPDQSSRPTSEQRGGASLHIESPTLIAPVRMSWYVPERSALPCQSRVPSGRPLRKRCPTALAPKTQSGSMAKNRAISDSHCRAYGPGQSLWPTPG